VSELELRRATWADREALLDMLARAFSWPAPPQLDFLAMMPHLFGERRIPDHLLALDGGQIIGVVGIYGYELKIDGVRLRGAALGQVATVPERRGQRVMSTLLRAATRLIELQGQHLSWLVGEARRYGAHGWAPGGRSVHYEFDRRGLPEPPDPSRVRALWPDAIVEALVDQREHLQTAVLMPVDELTRLVESSKVIGARYQDAWLVHDLQGDTIHFAAGPLEPLARLVAHVLSSTGKDRIAAVCAHEPNDLTRVGTRHATGYRLVPPCLWRIGKLAATLSAAAEAGRARLDGGSDAVCLENSDTGERVTLACEHGRVQVRAGGEAPIRLDTRELSKLCFGDGLIDHYLPDLRDNSPLRRILPLRVHHSPFHRF